MGVDDLAAGASTGPAHGQGPVGGDGGEALVVQDHVDPHRGEGRPQLLGLGHGGVGGAALGSRRGTLTQWAMPLLEIDKFLETAVYAQDQWTINRLTLNLGGRFQVAKGWVPAYEVPAGRFAPARQIPRQSNIPNWKDFSPRVGAAYDLFGNGKTALKAFIGKYPVSHSQDIVRDNNVLNLQPNSATRTWNDTDGNFVPDCDLTSPLANGECGAELHQ